ncbi:hypothetical protein [Maricaulis maris]|uniref:Uncharacterized protein n=1 Tax=Maricaulis maris TaxID=74318 RepID=A0A495D1M5_9PROT|nr:hypothetical protein [Maricaulis maris]RKQ95436.1 hypothetical protein C7435_2538 [Maricaulis maris]
MNKSDEIGVMWSMSVKAVWAQLALHGCPLPQGENGYAGWVALYVPCCDNYRLCDEDYRSVRRLHPPPFLPKSQCDLPTPGGYVGVVKVGRQRRSNGGGGYFGFVRPVRHAVVFDQSLPAECPGGPRPIRDAALLQALRAAVVAAEGRS